MRFGGTRGRSFGTLLAGLSLLLSGCGSGGYPNFEDLVDRASPSVVNISTVAGDGSATGSPASADPDMPDWLRKFQEDEPQPEGESPGGVMPYSPQPLGSGFVLWDDGYVLTNYHVVRDAKEIVVRLLDRREFVASLVGYDERSDLALLHIDAQDLPAVRLGDSDELRPGEWVLAIGSPFGFDYSVTAGIVSAKGRDLGSEQYVPYIQTDVAINPGNSGGPLFNLHGEVVGINSQIYSQSGGYQGVSFAIPIDDAAKVARQLRDVGTVTRGWLGVSVQPVTRDLAQTFGMDKPVGALVAKVVPGSPAEKAGLLPGDIILRFNGEPLLVSGNLPPMVGNVDPGKTVKLEVQRNGERLAVDARLGRLENQDVAESQDYELGQGELPPPPPQAAPMGLTVAPMSEEELRQEEVIGNGVLVIDVQPGPAAKAGIRTGDVLMNLGGQDIDSPERLDELVRQLTPGSSVPVLVSRGGSATFLALAVPDAATDGAMQP